MGGEDLLPPSSPSLSEPPPASAIKTKAVGGTSRAPPGKQRQANVKVRASITMYCVFGCVLVVQQVNLHLASLQQHTFN